VHGIVIAVRGKLVFEAYFDGFTHPTFGELPISYGRETGHCLSSVTKSVTATLLGIAIDRRIIPSVRQAVFGYLPEMADLSVGRKGDLTLEHLVTMSSGLEWDEWSYPYGDPRNILTKWHHHEGDPVRFVLERPLVAAPGTAFSYNSGLTNVLGEVIRRASGKDLEAFSAEHLFLPLGITEFSWVRHRPDFILASGDLSLRPRDLAKIGQLYLLGGRWEDSPVLSERWIDRSTEAFMQFGQPWQGHIGYGYGWWAKSEAYGGGAFAAVGWGGQAMVVAPEFALVAVFTGGSYWEEPLLTPHEMMLRFVLPAMGRGFP
jgi:CubicO group peptidase (beta-lactamase class C family)